MNSMYGTPEQIALHAEAQRIFSRDLPAIPLYFVPEFVAIRPEVKGVQLDPTQYLELWNIEAFDIDPTQ
ncbi:MAG: hypothetical protein GX620_18065 [Chloroflexi bacterium]|nr:hypothetical protein [Chloroflexota bacterium]